MLAEVAALVLALGVPDLPRLSGPAVYRPAERAVSNWRLEAVVHMDASLDAKSRILALSEPRFLPRCVRLNNYWCIKSARWNGEIAADREGHVAFASAHEGALVAAQLLRRYYVEFGRKTALAIVSRWAPAECAGPLVRTAPRARVVSAGGVSARGPARARPDGLSTRGIGNTLRARWLAGRGKGLRVTQVRSRVTERPVPMLRAPSIAVGMGEAARPLAAEIKLQPVRLASLGLPDTPTLRDLAPAPRSSCTGDATRIRNYAAKVAEGVAGGPTDDLKLFDQQGMPTDALRRVMANMASVEIGPMNASPELISYAVGKQVEGLRAKAANVAAAGAPSQD